MPYPLPGCWTTARMHSAALPAGSRPPSSPELPAMQRVAQPPADRTSAISVRHGCGCRTQARLQHRRPSPREELGSKYNIKMLKVHRLIRLKKKGKKSVIRRSRGGCFRQAPGKPGVAPEAVSSAIQRSFQAATCATLNIKACFHFFFFPRIKNLRECYFGKNCSGISKNVL